MCHVFIPVLTSRNSDLRSVGELESTSSCVRDVLLQSLSSRPFHVWVKFTFVAFYNLKRLATVSVIGILEAQLYNIAAPSRPRPSKMFLTFKVSDQNSTVAICMQQLTSLWQYEAVNQFPVFMCTLVASFGLGRRCNCSCCYYRCCHRHVHHMHTFNLAFFFF